MRLKGDQSTTRALNRRLVLNQLRHDGPLSRAAITAAVGLSPAGVTFVTAELIAEGLLVEREALLGAAGRRPVPLDIDYSSKLSIGLKVMVERVIGVITDLATRVVAETQIALPDSRPETVVKVSARVAERLLSQAKVNRSRVIGIGLTLAGQVDAEEGICRQMQRFGWRDVPIAAMLGGRRVGAGLGRQRRQCLRRRATSFRQRARAAEHRGDRAGTRRRRGAGGAWPALPRRQRRRRRVRTQFRCSAAGAANAAARVASSRIAPTAGW